MAIRRALVSVSDKTGLLDLVNGLGEFDIEILSTGGTAKTLSEAGLPVTAVSDVTKFPEMMDGRVKTLHPAIHAGLLAVRSNPEHMAALAAQGITPIDMVVVNLYPFAETIAKPDCTRELAIENIDIGGPSMIRSASKNHESVVVIVDPADYPIVLDEMRRNNGDVTPETRASLAAKAFAHTAAYDAVIASYLRDDSNGFPDQLPLAYSKLQDLRYGENPHQKAAFYRDETCLLPGIARATKLNGKELSFNNIYDLSAAFEIAQEFAGDTKNAFACVVKHTNPCGAALAPVLSDAFVSARAGDPISAFGGILAVTRPIDVATAQVITGQNTFFEAIVAPGYDDEALAILTKKKKWGANLILLETPNRPAGYVNRDLDLKKVSGGMLAQSRDSRTTTADDVTTATRRGPTSAELSDLLFAWVLVKHVKSNAIVLVKDKQLIGVGAGQMNRVQSVRLAVGHAGAKAKGAVLASDAFFPFADGPETAGEAGVVAIIQPGGSKKDDETIAMADQYSMAMVMTGVRHFRH